MDNYVFQPNKDKWIENKDNMKKASYSQIEKLFSCGMSWYLRYIKKFPEAFSTNLAMGSVYHYINEILYLEAFNSKGESFNYDDEKLINIAKEALDKIFPEYFLNKGLADIVAEAEKKSIECLIPILVAHYKKEKLMPISFKNEKGIEIPAVEIAVECPIERYDGGYRDDYYIYVKVDLVAKNKDGKIVVMDHKTASKSYSEMKLKIAQQLPIYAYAVGMLLKEHGMPYDNTVRYDVITKTKDPSIKIYEKTVKASNFLRATTYLNAGCEMLSSKKLTFCNSEMQCNMCNHKEACLDGDAIYSDFQEFISNNIVEAVEEQEKKQQEQVVPAVICENPAVMDMIFGSEKQNEDIVPELTTMSSDCVSLKELKEIKEKIDLGF